MWMQQEKGSAGIEFALILPVLALLIFGMMECGLALYNLQLVNNASREGARAGIIAGSPKPTVAEITAVVTGYLTNAAYDPSEAVVTVTGAGGAFPNPLTVTVTYPYQFHVLAGLIQGLVGDVNLRGRVTMRHE